TCNCFTTYQVLFFTSDPTRMKLLVNIKVDSATIARLQINYSVSGRCWKNAKNLMSKRTICSLISKQHMTESFESFYGAESEITFRRFLRLWTVLDKATHW